MEVKDLVEELEKEDCFKVFMKKYSDAYFCAAFFIFDEGGSEKAEIDFYVPSEKKMALFSYPFHEYNLSEEISGFGKMDLDLKIDVGDLKENVKNVLEKEGKKFDAKKIIAVLKNYEWHLTCMNGLDIIRMKIDVKSGNYKDFEKGSLMDFMGFKKT